MSGSRNDHLTCALLLIENKTRQTRRLESRRVAPTNFHGIRGRNDDSSRFTQILSAIHSHLAPKASLVRQGIQIPRGYDQPSLESRSYHKTAGNREFNKSRYRSWTASRMRSSRRPPPRPKKHLRKPPKRMRQGASTSTARKRLAPNPKRLDCRESY